MTYAPSLSSLSRSVWNQLPGAAVRGRTVVVVIGFFGVTSSENQLPSNHDDLDSTIQLYIVEKIPTKRKHYFETTNGILKVNVQIGFLEMFFESDTLEIVLIDYFQLE